MSTDTKHVTVKLGIWTIVKNKTPSLVPEWLFRLRSFSEQFWTSLGSLTAIASSEVTNGTLKDSRNRTGTGSKPAIEIRAITYVYTFVKEVYSLGPVYFVLVIGMSVWQTISGALRLYYSSRLLGSITHCLESRRVESFQIIEALACRFIVSVLSQYISKLGINHTAILRERVKYHFLEKTMHTTLNFDILTAADPEVRNRICSDLLSLDSEEWDAFTDIMGTLTDFFTILSDLWLILYLTRSNLTVTLSIAVCLVQELLGLLDGSNLYNRSFVAFCSNTHFLRMASLHRLAFDESFEEDRVTNNLRHYIEKEFKNSRRSLGDVNTQYLNAQWYRKQHIYSEVLNDLLWEFPLMLFALRVLWDYSTVTLSEFVFVQQASRSVHSSIHGLFFSFGRVSGCLLTIKNIYALADVENKVKDGDTPYPLRPDEEDNTGAAIEFQNVTFKYPGTDKDALSDISFTIKPGQLVVIVGVNGSGKSSAVKLLTRLYDPLAGKILLDGIPLSSYKLDDIRRAMVVLRQDHPILPLSLRENVTLGLPERKVSDEEVDSAIHQGGAEKLIQKLKQGLDTVLDPVSTVDTYFEGETDKSLKAVIADKEIRTELSGGETQRLSASRTFMKLMGGNVRLLVADEPTSALDPEGEYELFKRLREHSGRKTAIFVTHRFGHLTKFADLILCLKDGHLSEQGNHKTLMAMGGEYKKLYSLQAKAFVSE